MTDYFSNYKPLPNEELEDYLHKFPEGAVPLLAKALKEAQGYNKILMIVLQERDELISTLDAKIEELSDKLKTTQQELEYALSAIDEATNRLENMVKMYREGLLCQDG